MRIALITLFTLLTVVVLGQNNESVDLKWKLDKDETLKYATIMSDFDTASFDVSFGSFFKSFSDSTNNDFSESKDFLKKINNTLQNLAYVSTLSNKGKGVIDIVVSAKPKEEIVSSAADSTYNKEKDILKTMQAMTKGIILRGSVYETGGIHSFWVKSNQKNLIAILFQLPTHPVKVNDKWPLEINLISNDQSFVCDSAYKVNEVTLIDIKQENNQKIAVLKYNIIEYVDGEFNRPSFFGGEESEVPSVMKLSHQGIAEFSIDRGRWVKYNAIMSLEATGIINANKKTKFSLTIE